MADPKSDQNVSYQLGEIKGILSGILGELNSGRERHKNFTEIDADHERRIAAIEATRPHTALTEHSERINAIETKVAVYSTIATLISAAIGFGLHEILSFLNK